MPWAEHDYAEALPPSPPAFHPEMGYLAPSRSTRRVLRRGLIAAACGIALCAIAAVNRLPTQSSGTARADGSSTMSQSSTTGWGEDAAAPVDAREPAVAPSLAPVDGVRVATQAATPAADGLVEEPQSPVASAPQREKTVRKKKISPSHQEDTRNAYAPLFGWRSDYGTRYDYSMRS